MQSGEYDDIVYKQALAKTLEPIIKQWEADVEKERRFALAAKKDGELTLAEGNFGAMAAYKMCISQLRKLL